MSNYGSMLKDYLPEKEFLVKFAVDSYNKKYKRKLDYKNCRIKSVEKAFGYTYGYQIETVRSDDYVVIMLYFNLGEVTREHIVRVEAIQNLSLNGRLGDEVYVVTGEVARFLRESGVYKFKWIKGEGFNFSVVMFMNTDAIMFMDGDFLTFMEEAPAPPLGPIEPIPNI